MFWFRDSSHFLVLSDVVGHEFELVRSQIRNPPPPLVQAIILGIGFKRPLAAGALVVEGRMGEKSTVLPEGG